MPQHRGVREFQARGAQTHKLFGGKSRTAQESIPGGRSCRTEPAVRQKASSAGTEARNACAWSGMKKARGAPSPLSLAIMSSAASPLRGRQQLVGRRDLGKSRQRLLVAAEQHIEESVDPVAGGSAAEFVGNAEEGVQTV